MPRFRRDGYAGPTRPGLLSTSAHILGPDVKAEPLGRHVQNLSAPEAGS